MANHPAGPQTFRRGRTGAKLPVFVLIVSVLLVSLTISTSRRASAATSLVFGKTIAAGAYHIAVIKADATLWTMGSNDSGQLGRLPLTYPVSSSSQSAVDATPLPVAGLTDVVSVGAGRSHTVALKADGTVWDFGRGDVLGRPLSAQAIQLTDGSFVDPTPAVVPGLANVVAISVSQTATIALKADGTAWIFGGYGPDSNISTPTQLPRLFNVKRIVVGEYNGGLLTYFAVLTNGAADFGTAQYPIAAPGPPVPPDLPSDPGLRDVVDVVTFYGGGAALHSDGQVWTYGVGQSNVNASATGDGMTVVPFLDDVTDIAAGPYRLLARKKDGSVWTVGSQLQQFDPLPRYVEKLDELTDITAVSAGLYSSIALRADGSLWTFGSPYNFPLGHPAISTPFNRSVPGPFVDRAGVPFGGIAEPAGVQPVRALAYAPRSAGAVIGASANASGVLLRDGTVWIEGLPGRYSPDRRARRLSNMASIARQSSDGVLAVSAKGSLYWVGYGWSGRSSSNPPGVADIVPVGTAVTTAVGSAGLSMVLRTNGTVSFFGGNFLSGSYVVPGISEVIAVDASNGSSAILKSDGTVLTVGSNSYGQLGRVTVGSSDSYPTPVPGLSSVEAIATGPQGILALRSDGTIWGAGGDLVQTSPPFGHAFVPISPLTNVVSVLSSGLSWLALRADGTVWTVNPNPSLPFWSGAEQPAQVVGLSNIIQLSGGNAHFLALRSDGSVWSVGDNTFGQLGRVDKSLAGPMLDVPPVMRTHENDEWDIASLINSDRVALGLPVLKIDAALVHASRRWSAGLSTGTPSADCASAHDPAVKFAVLATSLSVVDNVGCGAIDPTVLYSAIAATAECKANIANSLVDSLGVGVAYNGDRMFVTEQFMDTTLPPPVSPTTVVTTTPPVPVSRAYVPVEPVRLVDTRAAGLGRRVGGQVTYVPVGGRGGVASDAAAVALNVTAVGPTEAGYLTVFPCGTPIPNASTLNFATGQTVANAALVKVGAGGNVCVFSSTAMDVLVDVTGFVPALSTFQAVVPTRLMDTRSESPNVPMAAGSTRLVLVKGRFGLSNPATVALNVTAVPDQDGYLTVFPCGTSLPNASNLNFSKGKVVANAVFVKVGDNGAVCVFSSATTHVIVDVSGAFEASAEVEPLNPVRMIDTRPGTSTVDGQFAGIGQRPANATTEIKVSGRGGASTSAQTVVLNVTVTGALGDGYVTVWPCGSPKPSTSTVNFTRGQTIANMAITKIGTAGNAAGKVCVASSVATQLIVDLTGTLS